MGEHAEHELELEDLEDVLEETMESGVRALGQTATPPPMPPPAQSLIARVGDRPVPEIPPPAATGFTLPPLTKRHDLGDPDERLEMPTAAPPAIWPPLPATSEARPSDRSQLHLAAMLLGVAVGLALSPLMVLSFRHPAPTRVLSPVAPAAPATWHAGAFELQPAARPTAAPPPPSPRKVTQRARRPPPVRKVPGVTDVVSAKATYSTLRSRFKACNNGQPGEVLLRLSVQPSGKISHARVFGPRLQGAVASCMARNARGLFLPASKGATQQTEVTLSW